MKINGIQAGILAVVATAFAGGTIFLSCQSNDRNPTAAEVKAADVKRLNYIDQLPNLSQSQRLEMRSHMGGAAYQNPAIAAAMAAARAKGAKIPANGRKF